jgi:hypothetical protein
VAVRTICPVVPVPPEVKLTVMVPEAPDPNVIDVGARVQLPTMAVPVQLTVMLYVLEAVPVFRTVNGLLTPALTRTPTA